MGGPGGGLAGGGAGDPADGGKRSHRAGGSAPGIAGGSGGGAAALKAVEAAWGWAARWAVVTRSVTVCFGRRPLYKSSSAKMVDQDGWIRERRRQGPHPKVYGGGGLAPDLPNKANHDKIRRLLEELRHQGGTRTTLRIRPLWLILTNDQMTQLRGALSQPKEALDELASKFAGFGGQITCFDGQTVHLVSGRGRTVVSDVEPVLSAGAYRRRSYHHQHANRSHVASDSHAFAPDTNARAGYP